MWKILPLALLLVLPASAQPTLTGAGKTVVNTHTIAFTTLANGTVGGAAIAGSGTYTGTAPSSISSATWGGGCSGSSAPASFSASVGAWSATFTVPGSSGTGCTIAITDNLGDTATSPGVTISGGSYVGPLDVTAATPVFCLSFRPCSTAIAAAGTQVMFNLVAGNSGSSGPNCDFLATNSAPYYGLTTNCAAGGTNGQTRAVFCASGCRVNIKYDQTGNGNTFNNPTGGSEPAFTVVSGPSSGVAAMVCDGTRPDFLGGSSPGTTQPYTISTVAIRTGSFTSQQGILAGAASPNAQISYASSTNTVFIYAAGGLIGVTASDNVWHTLIGVFNGATSSIKVDGAAPTSVSNGTGVLGSGLYLCGSAPNNMTGAEMETIAFVGGLSAGDQTALEANQHTFGGF